MTFLVHNGLEAKQMPATSTQQPLVSSTITLFLAMHNGLEAKQIPLTVTQQPFSSSTGNVLAHNGLEAKQMPAAEMQQPFDCSALMTDKQLINKTAKMNFILDFFFGKCFVFL